MLRFLFIFLVLQTFIIWKGSAPKLIKELHLMKLHLIKESQGTNWPKALLPPGATAQKK